MIAITPPKIFSKEVAQKQATPLTAPATSLTTKNRFAPHFRGWRLDEFSIFARPPPRGLAHARPDDLEAFRSGLGHAASGTTYLPNAVTLASLYDCAKKVYKLVTRRQG